MPLTSTVCLIAKNEGPYLKEWIAYHRILGFDQIVVYENNSSDNSAEILEKLSRAGKVTHRVWKLGARESAQITAYRDALKRCRTDWLLFIDADEFLVLHNHRYVNDFLRDFHDQKDITAVGINWRIFGDGGCKGYDSRPVMRRFLRASKPQFGVNAHIKSFIRVKAQKGIVHMHTCQTTGRMVHASGVPLVMPDWGLSAEIEHSHAQVNHYYTKTAEEYALKKQRGSADVPDTDPVKKYNWYHDEAFHGHNRNDVGEKSILKLYEEVVREMETMDRELLTV
ncbi:glycosyltransferase family 2 protein [Asticcacaulis solisilvae]|uniref:glycosyltransferase family 2 protein n=1 Tax=Asticcacaulis solisilvae TaxID=1217274 RepID=UPI003FD8A884